MTLRPYRRWLHALTGLSLGMFLVLPAGAQTKAPTAATPTGKPAMPPAVRAELQKIEKESPRHDEPAEAQEFLRLRVAPAGQKDVPVERYFEAIRQMETMPQYSTARRTVLPSRAAQGISSTTDASSLGAWSSLGPGNIGGRTRALVIHPQNPQIMFAAGVAGGVWKTTDGGTSWAPVSDLLANIAISTLVMSPKNPNVLYAGTGEGFYNGDSIRGGGIFRTTDGGATWARLASTTGADFNFVNKLVVSKQAPGRLYAATRTGVWRSLNFGTSWTRVLDPQVFGGCLDLAIRTDKTADVVFASCGTFEQATVYRNQKAHQTATWSPVLRDRGMGRTTLAIAPSNQNIIYALAASVVNNKYLDGLHAVFRSTDGGSTWKAQVRNTSSHKLDTLLLSNPIIAYLKECFDGENVFINQGWYDNVIAVDPKDPNRVWAGGVDLFRSDDGGKRWGLASYWWTQFNDGSFPPFYAHADQHVIVFHPRYNGSTNKTMFVGNDGGIYKIANARAATAKSTAGICANSAIAQTDWETLNNGYGVTQFYHGLPYPGGETYFGGTQDNGTIRGNDADGPNAWEAIFGGDGGFVAIDPTDPDTIYQSTPGLALRKSTDGGLSWEAKIDGIDENPANFLFVTPFVMDPSNPDRLWIGGSQLWRTNDAAESWNAASDVVPSVDFPIVSAIAVAPTDSNRVLAGTVEGYVVRNTSALSATGSTVWPSSRPRTGYVSWVAYDPVNPSIVYATYTTFGGAHVWKSTDGGATWSPLDGTGAGTLPDIPVDTIAIDPANTSHLFIGTDAGVFSSIDGGQTWMVENTGFANVPVWALAIQDGTLFAFTHGRGVWRIDLP